MKILLRITILLLFASTTFFFLESIYANDTECPGNLTEQQCLNYLQEKAIQLREQSKKLSQNLTDEEYKQLSLQEQIRYMEGQIARSEEEIKKTEIELKVKDVEIRILEIDIQETQNNIITVIQERKKLKETISKRLILSYKYSFMHPLELLMQTQDLGNLLQKNEISCYY